MENTTVLQFKDKDKRNEVFQSLREAGESPVRFSDPVPVMVSESEFKLDEKGRVIWETAWFVAYPTERSSWKRLKNDTKSKAN